MAFSKKTWLDRIAEYPTRRRLKKSDGTDEIVSVSREEGAISQEGDAFSAANMNDLEDRVASEFNSLNLKLQEVNKNLFTAHPQYNTSADMIKKNGIYYSTTWTGKTGNYGVLVVFGDNSSYIFQLFMDAVNKHLFYRATNDGTSWTEWSMTV